MTPNNQTIVKFSIVGLILPILASPLVNFILVSQGPKRVDDRGFIVGSYTFSEYYQILITNPPKLAIFMSLCALINLPVFFWFLNKQKDYQAKGVLMGTLVYFVIFMIFKLG
jgi:hypothetical protein